MGIFLKELLNKLIIDRMISEWDYKTYQFSHNVELFPVHDSTHYNFSLLSHLKVSRELIQSFSGKYRVKVSILL